MDFSIERLISDPMQIGAAGVSAVLIGVIIRSSYKLIKAKKSGKTGPAASSIDPDACPKFSDIPTVSDKSHYQAAYPPEREPAQALTVQDMFRANAKLIRDLCYASKLTEEEYQKYLLPVISNLAHVIHLVPASEYDHHTGYGGLFTHCLEVAYYAANQAKNTIFDRASTPQEIHWNRRRWILTCILAALTHDIGKPYTDMEIVTEDGRHWTKDIPLLDWLRREKVDKYWISFNEMRKHNEHVSVALQKFQSVVPEATLSFLGSTGIGERMQKELRDALLEGNAGGLIGKILVGADGLSREADARNQRKVAPVYKNVANPQGSNILNAMRALIQEGVWKTNEDEHSQIFNTKMGCFVVWTEELGEKIWAQATAMNAQGVPKDYLKIAEILIDSKAAIPNNSEFGHTYSNLWEIIPILTGNVPLMCLRLKDPGFIFVNDPGLRIDVIVGDLPIDEETKKAWNERWKYIPLKRLSAEEMDKENITESLLTEEQHAQEERKEELDQIEAEAEAMMKGVNVDIGEPPEEGPWKGDLDSLCEADPNSPENAQKGDSETSEEIPAAERSAPRNQVSQSVEERNDVQIANEGAEQNKEQPKPVNTGFSAAVMPKTFGILKDVNENVLNNAPSSSADDGDSEGSHDEDPSNREIDKKGKAGEGGEGEDLPSSEEADHTPLDKEITDHTPAESAIEESAADFHAAAGAATQTVAEPFAEPETHDEHKPSPAPVPHMKVKFGPAPADFGRTATEMTETGKGRGALRTEDSQTPSPVKEERKDGRRTNAKKNPSKREQGVDVEIPEDERFGVERPERKRRDRGPTGPATLEGIELDRNKAPLSSNFKTALAASATVEGNRRRPKDRMPQGGAEENGMNVGLLMPHSLQKGKDNKGIPQHSGMAELLGDGSSQHNNDRFNDRLQGDSGNPDCPEYDTNPVGKAGAHRRPEPGFKTTPMAPFLRAAMPPAAKDGTHDESASTPDGKGRQSWLAGVMPGTAVSSAETATPLGGKPASVEADQEESLRHRGSKDGQSKTGVQNTNAEKKSGTAEDVQSANTDERFSEKAVPCDSVQIANGPDNEEPLEADRHADSEMNSEFKQEEQARSAGRDRSTNPSANLHESANDHTLSERAIVTEEENRIFRKSGETSKETSKTRITDDTDSDPFSEEERLDFNDEACVTEVQHEQEEPEADAGYAGDGIQSRQMNLDSAHTPQRKEIEAREDEEGAAASAASATEGSRDGDESTEDFGGHFANPDESAGYDEMPWEDIAAGAADVGPDASETPSSADHTLFEKGNTDERSEDHSAAVAREDFGDPSSGATGGSLSSPAGVAKKGDSKGVGEKYAEGQEVTGEAYEDEVRYDSPFSSVKGSSEDERTDDRQTAAAYSGPGVVGSDDDTVRATESGHTKSDETVKAEPGDRTSSADDACLENRVGKMDAGRLKSAAGVASFTDETSRTPEEKAFAKQVYVPTATPTIALPAPRKVPAEVTGAEPAETASSPVKERKVPAALRMRSSQIRRRSTANDIEEKAGAFEERLLAQLMAGKGDLIPNGCHTEFGVRWAEYSAFEETIRQEGLDMSGIAHVAARRTSGPSLSFDFKQKRVFFNP